MDELEARARSLLAERQRPERVITLDQLLEELIATIHKAYLSPPDQRPMPGLAPNGTS